MQYLVDTIVEELIAHNPMEDDEVMIRIYGFEDIRIYEQICRNITKYYEEKEKKEQKKYKLIMKLSQRKWEEFKVLRQDTAALQSMEINGWTADESSLTRYRNAHEANVLVLMGTEAEDDKGGLMNCYTITPETVITKIEKQGYHKAFAFPQEIISKEDQKIIDKLFDKLFKVCSINVQKYSDCVDKWKGNITDLDDFKEQFFASLRDWGLPFWREQIPSNKEITGRKNFFQDMYLVVTHEKFNTISKAKINTYKNIFDEYESNSQGQSGMYALQWPNGQSVESYDACRQLLMDFILGKDIAENQKKLLGIDYGIIRDIFGWKLEKKKTQKKNTIQKVSGDPFPVFLEVLLKTLADREETAVENGTETAAIKIVLKQVDIVCPDSTEEESGGEERYLLYQAWQNIGIHANGVVAYITKNLLQKIHPGMLVELSPQACMAPQIDMFEQLYEEGKIKAAGASKTVNKISFVVQCLNENNKAIRGLQTEYEWTFANESAWLNAFSDIVKQYDNYKEKQQECIWIPMPVMEHMSEILFAKSEEEFFDLFAESNIDYTINLLDYVQMQSEHTSEAVMGNQANADNRNNQTFNLVMLKLGAKFVRMLQVIKQKGYYALLEEDKNILDEFLMYYLEQAQNLLLENIPESEEWKLDVLIHAFVIEESKDIIWRNKDAKACMVPPWHPTVLEKLWQQKQFIVKGMLEWWNKETNHAAAKMVKAIAELVDMSQMKSATDVFPSKDRNYFGLQNSYGNYFMYARKDIRNTKRLRDIIHKEGIFDDDFKDREYADMTEDAQMIYRMLQKYVKAFPNASNALRLTFIDPSNLQPVIAAVHNYIKQKADEDEQDYISVEIRILVKPENRGGRNYLAYWMDTFFSQDENVNVKIYLSEWDGKNKLADLVQDNQDMIFVMDLLKLSSLQFIPDDWVVAGPIEDCVFPMVNKPSAPSVTSMKRRVELTQTQFALSTTHTQLVRYRNNTECLPKERYIAVKELEFSDLYQEMLKDLHEKSYWVVCVDSGMDGALLGELDDGYSIIGYSTGQGNYGQYNITITARPSILATLKKQLHERLYQLFHWDQEVVAQAANYCLLEAGKLDGISLLAATNQKDDNIREFMAYVLTSLREREKKQSVPLRTVVHLDSYLHWFDGKMQALTGESKSRPDFLILEAQIGEHGKIAIHATVTECKTASFENADGHIIKGLDQVRHGLAQLQMLFDPKSKSIKRRYWYTQLYRALSFSQVTFANNTAEFAALASELRRIVDGEFEITWSGQLLGYWLDCQGVEEQEENVDNNITIVHIPQQRIQQLLLHGQEQKIIYSVIAKELVEKGQKVEQETKVVAELVSEKENEQTAELETKTTKMPEVAVSVEPKMAEMPKEKSESALEDVKVLIGTDRMNQPVYWEFGHKDLNNRHMLITGTSGQGKTYCIQTLLSELTPKGISAVIFDYTEGYRMNQLDEQFVAQMKDCIDEETVYFTGVPVNPFRRQEITISGTNGMEKTADVAQRIAAIMQHVYDCGVQQYAAIYEACKMGIDKYGEQMNMQYLRQMLEESTNKAAVSVLSKMSAFFDSVEFISVPDFDWEDIIYPKKSKVTIFQLSGYTREMQVIITELMLWDLYYFSKKAGTKDKPFAVVLDEAQNLSHKNGSPSESILREGRKFGWSAWFATQSLKSLADEEIVNLQQAPLKLYFKPTAEEMLKMAKLVDPDNSQQWIAPLKNLRKAQCIVDVGRVKPDGTFGAMKPAVTDVTSFAKRKMDERE